MRNPDRGVIVSRSRNSVIFAVCIFVFCLVAVGPAFAGMDVVKLSIPYSSLGLRENERIGGFEVDVSGGQVTSFANAPAGWQICIRNDPNQTARIGGNAFVGSAFLEASFFNDFVSVRTDGQPESPTIKVKIAVMNGVTLEQRSIDLEMKDLVLKKVGEEQ